MVEGDVDDPKQHPIAIVPRRRRGINGARVSKHELYWRMDDAAVALKGMPYALSPSLYSSCPIRVHVCSECKCTGVPWEG
jgi:hypothetical protein